MEVSRQEKIARMLQKEFGDIFVHYARRIQGVIISVSEVRITPDLSIARVYLSIFPTSKAQEIIEAVNRDTKALRYELGQRVRHQLRIIPEVIFHNDDSMDRLAKIDEILAANPISPEEPEDNSESEKSE